MSRYQYQSEIIELEPRAAYKKIVIFGQIFIKFEVMITSLIEMLELPNFG